MATYQSGGRRKATANTVTAMRRSAESRQCPKCGRKAALRREDFGDGAVTYCRWSLDDPPRCDYVRRPA